MPSNRDIKDRVNCYKFRIQEIPLTLVQRYAERRNYKRYGFEYPRHNTFVRKWYYHTPETTGGFTNQNTVNSGRKRVISTPLKKKLEKQLEHPRCSYRKVALNNSLSKSTLNKNLKKSSENPEGVTSYKILEDKNINMTPATREHRLDYSRERQHCDFEKTVFFDETIILLDGEPNRQNVRDRRTKSSTTPRRTKRKRTGNAGFGVGVGFNYSEKMDLVFFANGPRPKKRRVGDPDKLVFDHMTNNDYSF